MTTEGRPRSAPTNRPTSADPPPGANPPQPAAPEPAAQTDQSRTDQSRTDRDQTPQNQNQSRTTSSAGPPAPPARPAAATRPAPVPRPRKKSFLRELPGIVITALVISVLIKTFLVQAFYIPSGSMENTLLVNDRVLVNKLADKPDEIHRGDIVVFRDPDGWLAGSEENGGGGGVVGGVRKALVFVGLAPAAGEEDLIKRVVGVGGDRVRCCVHGKVTVNGVPLDEAYLYPGDLDTPSASDFSVTVPRGELWVMGDHRSVSEDSRAHRGQPGRGFVPVDDVIGRAFTIVWPLDRATLMHRPDTFRQARLTGPGP